MIQKLLKFFIKKIFTAIYLIDFDHSYISIIILLYNNVLYNIYSQKMSFIKGEKYEKDKFSSIRFTAYVTNRKWKFDVPTSWNAHSKPRNQF